MNDHSPDPNCGVKERRSHLRWLGALAVAWAVVAVAVAVLVHRFGLQEQGVKIAWLSVPQERIGVAPTLSEADSIPAGPGALNGCNLLLVTLDTTRADRIRCYGNRDIETPTLDRLAQAGVLFSQALAPTPTTLPSHATILTGLYPVHHGVRANGVFRLSRANRTLAEMLSENGYRTGAVISAFVLSSRFGLDQGFDRYDDDLRDDAAPDDLGVVERRADQTTKRALRWLDGAADEPFFLWVHYFDPHAVYQPPGPYAERYAHNPYDGEIAFVDSQLGILLGAIEERGWTDRTLVVAVGDHGEGLAEHNEHTHGYLLYDVTLKVPLIMSCGRRLGGGVHVNRRVSLVDLAPTVLTLLGVETTDRFDGADLTRPPAAPPPLYAETYHGLMEFGWAALQAVYDGDHKYIHGPNPELFDLVRDPFERQNLLVAQPQLAATLVEKLTRLFGTEIDGGDSPAPTAALTPEELAKLQSLGYVFSGSGVESTAGPRPDPKEGIELVNRVFEIVCYYRPRGELEKSIELLEQLTDAYPDGYVAFSHLGAAYLENGQTSRAAEAYARCVDLRPDAPESLYSLASVLITQGEREQAAELLRRVLRKYDDHFHARYDLGRILSQEKRYGEAADQSKRAFELDPSYKGCAAFMVQTFTAADREPELLRVLRSCLKEKPKLPSVRDALAGYLVGRQRFREAEELLREGATLMPDDAQSVGRLAWFLVNCPDEQFRRPTESRLMMERFCQATDNRDPRALFTLARIHVHAGRVAQGITIAEQAEALADDAGREDLRQAIAAFLTRRR